MIHGTLARLHLGDLLQWLQMGGLTGRLTLVHAGRERRFDFLEGRVVYASSLAPRERLATWMAAEGVLPAAQLRHSLSLSMLRRSLFSDVLQEHTGVDPEAVRASLQRLAETMATRILLAPEVKFTFDPGYPVRDLLNLSLDLEPHRLMLEAARRSDEGADDTTLHGEHELPVDREAFDAFFWEAVSEAVSAAEPLDGQQLGELYGVMRRVVAALGQWVESGPGLVPVPALQAGRLAELVAAEQPIRLDSLPHVAWNQMVLACSVRSTQLERPQRLDELEACNAEVWRELARNQAWHRPGAGRLDELTDDVAWRWSRAAAAAAKALKVEPGAAALAALLYVVPTDLVLWVLGTVPVPHPPSRRALLRRLPQRLGAALARSADLPAELLAVLAPTTTTAVGACLAVARDAIPGAVAWPAPVPEEPDALLDVASVRRLARAAKAARAAAAAPNDGPGTVR